MASFESTVNDIVESLARYGRHARLVLYTNCSGVVVDSIGKIVIKFSSIGELKRKLDIYEVM